VFDNPKKRNGELRKPYKEFINNKTLKRLKNGFVVFTPEVFTDIKQINKLLVNKKP